MLPRKIGLTSADIVQHLSTRYQAVQQALQQLCHANQIEFEKTVAPWTERRMEIDRLIQVIELKVTLLTQHACGPALGAQFFITGHYQTALAEAIESMVGDYHNLIKERDYIYRNNELLDIRTDAAKATELARYRQSLVFTPFTINQYATTALAHTLISQLQAEKQALMTEYNDVYDSQTEKAAELDDLNSPVQAQARFFREQQRGFHGPSAPEKNPITEQLESACRRGNLGEIQQASTADIKKHTPYLLHLACREGQSAIVDHLLRVRKLPINTADDRGYYPIHCAVELSPENDSKEAVSELILNSLAAAPGFNVNQRGGPRAYARTALHTASEFNNMSAVDWLLMQPKIDIDAQEQGGRRSKTPLHNAAYHGHAAIINRLLDHNANSYKINSEDYTPLMELLNNTDKTAEERFALASLFHLRHCWLRDEDLQHLQKCRADFNEAILPVIRAVENNTAPDEQQTSTTTATSQRPLPPF